MRSRTNGALRGIWGSPQQAETGRFSLRRKSPGLPKGYHEALLARVYPEFCVNVLRECKQQKLV